MNHQLEAIRNSDFLNVLEQNILDFWMERMIDPSGGFYGRIDGHGVLHPNADKAIILNTRILWTFSAAFQVTGNNKHKKTADRAFDFLINHFLDKQHGGVFWMLDSKGNVVADKKQIYAQAFAIYALAEYHKVNESSDALAIACEFFKYIEKHSFDKDKNGYLEALDVTWSPLLDVRLSDKDMNATKTMNTHLHVLEAYTNLYRIWPDPFLRKQLKNLIVLMSSTFLTENGHFKLFFNDEWQLLSNEISFGHDIEGSWLLCEAAEVLGDQELIGSIENIATHMVDAAKMGLDQDGGLMNEANDEGLTDTDKHWWPQAEALVGLFNAWQITDNEIYLSDLVQVWGFISKNLIDREGEWHWKVNRVGQIDYAEDKAGPWKCPYHNSRAMIEILKRTYLAGL